MPETFHLTPLGAFHTGLALLAVLAGVVALVRHGVITARTTAGIWYIRLTAATCVTALFLFRHGGFGAPHALAVATLVVLAITYLLESIAIPSGPVRYVVALGNSLTLFFHYVPALTEVGTRLPPGHPAFTGPDDPLLQRLYVAGFLVYVLGAAIQVRHIRRSLAGIA